MARGTDWSEISAIDSARTQYREEQEQEQKRRKEKPIEMSGNQGAGLAVLVLGAALYYYPGLVAYIALKLGIAALLIISLLLWPRVLKDAPYVGGPALCALVVFALIFRSAGFAQNGPLEMLHFYPELPSANGFMALLLAGLMILPLSPILLLSAVLVPRRWLPEMDWLFDPDPQVTRVLAWTAPLFPIALLVVWYSLTDKWSGLSFELFKTDTVTPVAAIYFAFAVYGVLRQPRAVHDPMEHLRKAAMEQMEQEREEEAKR